jgi:ABC-type branched-subunit amino acid transport system substrate-binding protein
LAYLISSQGWKNIALIYATDTQTYNSVQIFLTTAQKLNLTIVVSTSFAAGSSNLTTQIQTIKQSQARIILFIGAINDQQTVIECSLAEGLTGIGYQWIAEHGSMHKELYLNSTGGIIEEYYQWSQGLLGVQAFADVNSNIYKEYAQRWSTTPYDPETSTVDPETARVDPNSISVIANFAYDACFMFAYALHKMIEVLDLDPMKIENRELFLRTLKNVSFLGVSGNVSVDQNGDRIAPFDIVNFQGDQIVRIASISLDDQVNYLPNITILYTGGTETKPLDFPIRPLIKISRSIQIGMIGGSITCTILCLV